MRRADYNYRINDNNIVMITDLDTGNLSVTNDIENVIEEIKSKESITDVDNFVWIYSDSNGEVDGYDTKNSSFFYIGAKSYHQALETNIVKQRIAEKILNKTHLPYNEHRC